MIHGDAIKVLGLFCIVLSEIWGYVSANKLGRVLVFMTIMRILRIIDLPSASNNGSRFRSIRKRRGMMGGA